MNEFREAFAFVAPGFPPVCGGPDDLCREARHLSLSHPGCVYGTRFGLAASEPSESSLSAFCLLICLLVSSFQFSPLAPACGKMRFGLAASEPSESSLSAFCLLICLLVSSFQFSPLAPACGKTRFGLAGSETILLFASVAAAFPSGRLCLCSAGLSPGLWGSRRFVSGSPASSTFRFLPSTFCFLPSDLPSSF